MKSKLPLTLVMLVFAAGVATSGQTGDKAQECDSYARNAAAAADPAPAGPVRAAGAAGGALLGAAQRSSQKSRSYQAYNDRCLAH